jgi:predicted phage-related endonuclease
MRNEGRGPAYRRDGIRPVYPASELRRWAEEQLSPLVRHTTEERQAGKVLPGREAING